MSAPRRSLRTAARRSRSKTTSGVGDHPQSQRLSNETWKSVLNLCTSDGDCELRSVGEDSLNEWPSGMVASLPCNTVSPKKLKRDERKPRLLRGKNADRPAFKPCDRKTCPMQKPVCIIKSSPRCSGSGWTARWAHLSDGEHVCNDCFEYFYRERNKGHSQYQDFVKAWKSHTSSKDPPSLRTFMAEECFPYWAKCKKENCEKWRMLNSNTVMSPEFLSTFCCTKASGGCELAQDEVVSILLEDRQFEEKSTFTTLFKFSPAAKFLTAYVPEQHGLSPLDVFPTGIEYIPMAGHHPKDVPVYLKLFVQPGGSNSAVAVRPLTMEFGEQEEFPDLCKFDKPCFLALRNIILTLWNQNSQDWLTVEKCSQYVVCRGLHRVYCVSELLPRLLHFYSTRGQINFGLTTDIPASLQILQKPEKRVVVIGAGLAGITAARHLHNYGCMVTVLEAGCKIGGRISDVDVSGSSIGLGSHRITGMTNNPLVMLAHQRGLSMTECLNNSCNFQGEGVAANRFVHKKVDQTLDVAANNLALWSSQLKHDVGLNAASIYDVGLRDKLLELMSKEKNPLSKYPDNEVQRTLQAYFRQMECYHGADLNKVSAIFHNHASDFAEYEGPSVSIEGGLQKILERLAEDLDVKLSEKVMHVSYAEECGTVKSVVYIETEAGRKYVADHVVVAVPLAVLQKHKIKFKPELPPSKLNALQHLGLGQMETLVMEFPVQFWQDALPDKEEETEKPFLRLLNGKDNKNMFTVFTDHVVKKTGRNGRRRYILSTNITGDAVQKIRGKSDKQVMEMCLDVLRKMFPHKEVPTSTSYHVSRWNEDENIGMAFSYIKVGGNSNAYDRIGQNVASKLFFVGEATTCQFAQTLNGAFMTGTREASKILQLE